MKGKPSEEVGKKGKGVKILIVLAVIIFILLIIAILLIVFKFDNNSKKTGDTVLCGYTTFGDYGRYVDTSEGRLQGDTNKCVTDCINHCTSENRKYASSDILNSNPPDPRMSGVSCGNQACEVVNGTLQGNCYNCWCSCK